MREEREMSKRSGSGGEVAVSRFLVLIMIL
jgi:hypothetical protein